MVFSSETSQQKVVLEWFEGGTFIFGDFSWDDMKCRTGDIRFPQTHPYCERERQMSRLYLAGTPVCIFYNYFRW